MVDRIARGPIRRVLVGMLLLGALGAAGGYAVTVRSTPAALEIDLAASPSPESGGRERSRGASVWVHVAGAVARPGLYELAAGDRVADAVDAAGGPAADADLDAVNLASKVQDGDKIAIPRRGAASGGGAGGAAAGPGRLDLNAATEADLDALPGIGPATAKKIIAWREQNGGFRDVKDLLKVPGIGPAKFEGLRDLVTV